MNNRVNLYFKYLQLMWHRSLESSHFPSPSLPNRYEHITPTRRDQGKAFPRVTGRRFLKRAVLTETPEEHKSPAGRRNIFATECSKPIATKVEIGKKILMYFPIISLALKDRKTARHTSQLQSIAFTINGPIAHDVFAPSVFAARSAAPPANTTEYLQSKAKQSKAGARNQVSDMRQAPRARRVLHISFLLANSGRHVCCVTSKKLTPSLETQEQIGREIGKAGIELCYAFHVTTNRQGQHSSYTNKHALDVSTLLSF